MRQHVGFWSARSLASPSFIAAMQKLLVTHTHSNTTLETKPIMITVSLTLLLLLRLACTSLLLVWSCCRLRDSRCQKTSRKSAMLSSITSGHYVQKEVVTILNENRIKAPHPVPGPPPAASVLAEASLICDS